VDDMIKKTIVEILKEQQIDIRYLEQSLQTKVTIIVVDRRL